jgi:hypothetical protein
VFPRPRIFELEWYLSQIIIILYNRTLATIWGKVRPVIRKVSCSCLWSRKFW